MSRQRFAGEIFGVGTESGVRIVIGSWQSSPFGTFSDAMVESDNGHRLLIAPSNGIADYVAATYSFDEICVAELTLQRVADRLDWAGGPLHITIRVGARTGLGRAMRLVPVRVATSPAWSTMIDPVARIVLKGVRTKGTAGNGRREWYGAHDVHELTAVQGTFRALPLGALTPVDPPVSFGFGSTPRRPSVVAITSTVDTSDTVDTSNTSDGTDGVADGRDVIGR